MDEIEINQIEPEFLYNNLMENNFEFFTGVPDSLLKEFCKCVDEKSQNHIISANEGTAIGLASGVYLATNKYPVVYLQNSGLGNIVNPVMSLTHEKVYQIPMLIIIGWRGEPGKKDEPQHKAMGKITCEILDLMNVPYDIMPDYNEGVQECIDNAVKHFKQKCTPYALIVRKGSFKKYESIISSPQSTYNLKREDLIKIIIDNIDEESTVISTTGMCSRELYEYREKTSSVRDFMCVGCMGHTSSIGLGVSLNSDKQTYILDGDGSILMHMGSMAINGQFAGKNFKHILLNNGAHDSVGGQKTVGYDISFNDLAKSQGYKVIKCYNYNNEYEIKEAIEKLNKTDGPVFLELRCCKGARKDLGRPKTNPFENKKFFQDHLNN